MQALQKICKDNGAIFLLDEVQTGGGPTGKMWAHEHFDLPEAPDIVSFSKKMQTGELASFDREKIFFWKKRKSFFLSAFRHPKQAILDLALV